MEMIQPLVDIVKVVWKPVNRYMGYAINLEKNWKELNKRGRELFDKMEDTQNQIENAGTQEAPTKEYLGWLEDVNEMEKEVKRIEENRLYDKRCFRGWFPDMIARAKLGEHVVEMIEQVKELQQKSIFEGGFLVDLPPKIGEMRPIHAFKAEISIGRTLRKVVECIRNEEIQKIGIWGMGGVGKTTIMTILNNTEEIREMFQIVIWVTVSKSWSIENLQDTIIDGLSLNVQNKSGDTRKPKDQILTLLFQELQRRKCLLLLDDVWEMVDLSKLGIPFTDQEKSCKIVLTTRELRVCRKMETDVDIKVETLSEEEAWELFSSKVGEIAMYPTINATAKEIVRECGGLPLALNVVGGALRKVEDEHVWRNLLKRLKSPDISYVTHTSDRIFESLKATYDELKDTNIKNCFLYCGLYPEDHRIAKSELIAYWRAEGLLSSSSRGTLEDAGDEGNQLLHDLTDASLLEKCNDDHKHVKMHDLVRDLVLKLTSSGAESRHVVRAGLLSEENSLVEDKEWGEATRISFMFNRWSTRLPERPNCPKLSTLLLQSHSIYYFQLTTIPKSFFNQMPSLRVLDLSYTRISSLPGSISNLVSLRALFLRGCSLLAALPRELRLMKRLEVFCLTKCDMKVMPAEIWELSSLKCLEFSILGYSLYSRYYSQFPSLGKVVFPNNTKEISQLCKLEEVSVMGEQDLESHQSVEAVAEEFGRQQRLSSLEFNFVTLNNLHHFLKNSISWKDYKLTEFYFIVGETSSNNLVHDHKDFKDRWKRCLVYGRGGDGSGTIFPSVMKEVLLRSHFFVLESHGEGKNLVSYLGVESTRGLRYCKVDHGHAFENILGEDELREGAFANLEILDLIWLENLRCFCNIQASLSSKQLSTSSFSSLRELKIGWCPKLKVVFPWRLVPLLVALESLQIDICWEIEEVFSGDGDGDDDEYELPKLKKLEFSGLPELVGCSKLGNVWLRCPLLEKVRVQRCPKLKTFPFGVNGAPNLKTIEGQQEWWQALEWKDDAAKSRFAPLFSACEW